MKKIISIILATAVSVQLAVLPVMAKVTSKAEHSWRVVNGIGLADFRDSQKEEKVSRIEFAKFLSGALGIVVDEETQKKNPALFEKAFYSNIDSDGYAEKDQSEEISIYNDIELNDDAYNSLKALYNLNIMMGDGEGYFHPERNIRYEEVLKTFVVLASYNVDMKIPGSWPKGYVTLASDLDIVLGGLSIGDEITKYQLCQIFYKLFDVEMMKVMGVVDDKAVYETVKGVTFLNEMIGLYSFKGQLEATSNSTLTFAYTSKNQSLTINGIEYSNYTTNPIGSLLGRVVEAYRTEDGKVVYMTQIDEEEVTVIDAKQEPYLNAGKIYYQIGEREKSIDVLGLPIIYNGVSAGFVSVNDIPEINELISIGQGTITVSEEAPQNVVMVWEYKDIIPQVKHPGITKLYDEYLGTSIDLDEEDNTIFIFDEEMNLITFDEIPDYVPVSYIENGTYKEVYVGGKEVSGKLKNINSEAMQLTIEDRVYEYTKALNDNNILNSLIVGISVKAYQNRFGKLFYVKAGRRVGEFGGILVRSYIDDNDEVGLRIYEETNSHINYNCADKVTFITSKNESYRLSPNEVLSQLGSYDGYLVYTVNAEEKIIRIQIPLESKSYLRPDEDRVWAREFKLTYRAPFMTGSNRLGSEMFINAETDIFSVPSNKNEFENYERLSVADLFNHEMFDGIAYMKNNDKPIPDAITIKDRHLKKYSGVNTSNEWQVVISIRDAIKDEDRLCKEVVLKNTRTRAETTVFSYYENGTTKFDNVKSPTQIGTYQLNEGDIVFYNTLPNSNEIRDICIIFSADEIGPNGKRGWIPGTNLADLDGDGVNNEVTDKYLIYKSVYNEWKESKYANDSIYMFIDAKGESYKITEASSTRKQNPFIITNECNYDADYIFPTFNYIGGRETFLGYVYDYTDGIVKITSQDLSTSNYNPTGTLDYNETLIGINFEKYFNIAASGEYLGLLEIYDNGVVARPALQEDIRTYTKAGHSCSKFLRCGRWNMLIHDYRTR